MARTGADVDVAVRLLVALRHPATRGGVRCLLERDGFHVCAEVDNCSAAVRAARHHRPDLCLVDEALPGDGIEATQQILHVVPDSAVVVLSDGDGAGGADDDTEQRLFDALAAGASGYLFKDIAPERLPPALRGVLAGEAALPRHLVARLVGRFRRRGRQRVRLRSRRRSVELTRREWEVLDLLRSDCSTEEMATRLDLSPVTVRRHVSRLMAKLQADSREDVIALLADHDGT
jgi:DNA-binding NarL/FixJ family response regulator